MYTGTGTKSRVCTRTRRVQAGYKLCRTRKTLIARQLHYRENVAIHLDFSFLK